MWTVTERNQSVSEQLGPHNTWLIVLVIVIGAGFWVTGIGHGFPSIQHPDEKHLVERAMIMSGDDLNPPFFAYPTFLIYVNLLLDGGT